MNAHVKVQEAKKVQNEDPCCCISCNGMMGNCDISMQLHILPPGVTISRKIISNNKMEDFDEKILTNC